MSHTVLNPAKLTVYCDLRLTPLLSPPEVRQIAERLNALGDAPLPWKAGRIQYAALSLATGLAIPRLRCAHAALLPLLAAMARAQSAPPRLTKPKSRPAVSRPRPVGVPVEPVDDMALPGGFAAALSQLMAAHGDTPYHVSMALRLQGLAISASTLRSWALGATRPRGLRHLAHLRAIAERYGLNTDTLVTRRSPRPVVSVEILAQASPDLRADLAWHLPADFANRTPLEQAEILFWIETTLGTGSTDYRRYLQARLAQPYAVSLRSDDGASPPSLVGEVEALLAFKTAAFVPVGQQRTGVWGKETAAQKRLQLGQMFGALTELGVKTQNLSLALLIVPSIWDAWLRWREARRGFYIQGEADLLRLAQSLARPGTGWLRQTPHLRHRLRVIKGLLTRDEITDIRGDWAGACDRLLAYAQNRARDIARVARVHRDPFEPILIVLESDSPVGAYRQITDDILRRMPDADSHPIEAAETVRAFLMLRLGLHLGLRQKNLRELRLCPRGQRPTAERKLEALRRGELRWNPSSHTWEVLIPAVAFKNAQSSFFEGRPFRVTLPDIGDLYSMLEAWIKRHRPQLVGAVVDPETVFVATSRGPKRRVELGKAAFYALWRQAIARYGVFNPYTGRGAIAGLLPHGPHGVRDVLATHILKATGSYEHAGYAIQDTADTVAQHYGRFLPKDKSALAAQIINRVWD